MNFSSLLEILRPQPAIPSHLSPRRETSLQEEHIRCNLPELIRLTNCNVLLLAELRKAGVLSELDEQELDHKYHTPMAKSKKLYDILLTRKNFYFILRDALEQTMQTGALSILNDGVYTEVLRNLNVSEQLKNDLRCDINSKDESGETLLHHAAKNHHIEQLELLTNLKPDFEAENPDGFTPLLMIVYSKQKFAETLTWFVKQKVNLNAEDNDGNNLVLLCVKFERSIEDIVEVISRGVNWKVKNKQEHTVLHIAVQQGNLVALKYFRSMGADINAKDNLGNTPFLQVCHAKQNIPELLSWFVDQNVDVNQVNNAGNNLVHLSVISEKPKKVLQQIVELGVDWSVKNCKHETVLHVAVESGNIEALKYFQSLGAIKYMHMTDIDGWPPILKLAKANKNFIEIFSWFVEQKHKFSYYQTLSITQKGNTNLSIMNRVNWFNCTDPDLNARSKSGHNLAHLCARFGKTKTELQEIVKCGVNWKTKYRTGGTVLHAAAVGGNVEALEYFFSLGADANVRDDRGYTPLLELSSAQQNFSEALKWFVNKQIDIQAVNNEGDNLIHLAVFTEKSKDELELIVESGIKWDVRNKNGQTVMHLLAKGGLIDGLKYFTSLGADANARDKYGNTLLLQLCLTKKNFSEALIWFVGEEIDLQAEDENGNNLVFLAALMERSKCELEQIVGIGVNWNSKNKNGQNVMHLAAQGGNIEALNYFKSLGADINAKDELGNTPVLKAARADKHFVETLKWFVKEQVDLQAENNDGNNLILLAAFMGTSTEKLKHIVDSGVNWNIRNKSGQSVMHLAAQGGNIEALIYFKSLGADVNAKDNIGYTPLLQLAVAKENFSDTLLWFVKEKVDLHAVNSCGLNLAHFASLAARSKHKLQLIVGCGIKWNIKDKLGQTVMHMAAAGGNIEALNYFKSLGADVNAKDNFGHTPFLSATYFNDCEFSKTFKWFVKEQVDLQAENNNGDNIIFLAVLHGRSKNELIQIVDSGVNLNIRNKFGQTVMHMAATGGNIEALKYFKSLGAEVDVRDSHGITPMLGLSFGIRNFSETLSWFVKEQVDLQAVDKNGNNLVLIAVKKGRSKKDLEQIVSSGIHWITRNHKDQSVFHLADEAGNTELLEYFKSLSTKLA